MPRLMSVLKDPLVFFLLSGAMIFLVVRALSGNEAVSGDTIEISLQEQQRFARIWELQWKRQPTAAELAGVIEAEIRERVYYREALALGLDKDDVIIRRRLKQKLEFITEGLAQSVPTQDQLQSFFVENSNRYLVPARYSFRHIYFNPDSRRDVEQAAKEALHLLQAGSANAAKGKHPKEMGDRFPLVIDTRLIDAVRVDKNFGPRFVRILEALPLDVWQGPIQSGLGHHLVLVERKLPAYVPPIEELQDDLLRDYIDDYKRRAIDEAYERMKSRYRIVIETGQTRGKDETASG